MRCGGWVVTSVDEQRFREPLHDACALNLGIRSQVRRWLPLKRTMTQPCNLRLFSEFHGSFVHKRTATFCGAARSRDRARRRVDRGAAM